ncbi:MAG TPA: hypothetical protein VLG16_01200 [Candidatus Saccharimonadales bacterium]|nr:hypothetical protein [Candidatus Saccharimonadales bacterium]
MEYSPLQPDESSRDQSFAYAAFRAMETLDALPPPRKIEPDEDMRRFGTILSLLGAKAEDPEIASKVLMGNLTEGDIARSAIRNLRLNGQRVGPFRARKIKKLIGFAE